MSYLKRSTPILTAPLIFHVKHLSQHLRVACLLHTPIYESTVDLPPPMPPSASGSDLFLLPSPSSHLWALRLDHRDGGLHARNQVGQLVVLRPRGGARRRRSPAGGSPRGARGAVRAPLRAAWRVARVPRAGSRVASWAAGLDGGMHIKNVDLASDV